tara:strand:+ start:221 stop:403 length:183 start_codon:yes stop_codon:yes gene_type:complete
MCNICEHCKYPYNPIRDLDGDIWFTPQQVNIYFDALLEPYEIKIKELEKQLAAALRVINN